MVVTTFKPDGDGPFPLVIISHGRAAAAVDRAKVPRQRYTDAARYFVQRGFAVVVPTRKGYGETGGSDPEHMGACVNPAFARSFDGALESIMPALEWAKSLPYVESKRILAVGTSMGGISTLALAARNPQGLIAAVNFAGGLGGDPGSRPGQPCAPDKLAQSYVAFGKAGRVPTLWLYSENDQYWGAELPKQWHKAYLEAGGKAEFQGLPPYGRDGHVVFSQAVSLWGPYVDAFLRENGLLP
jgi:dienelactone hydrolase